MDSEETSGESEAEDDDIGVWEVLSDPIPIRDPIRLRCLLCHQPGWYCQIVDEHKICIYISYYSITRVRNVDVSRMIGGILCEECLDKHMDVEPIRNYTCPLCQAKYATWGNINSAQGNGVATFYEGDSIFHGGDGSDYDGDKFQAKFDCTNIGIGKTICDKTLRYKKLFRQYHCAFGYNHDFKHTHQLNEIGRLEYFAGESHGTMDVYWPFVLFVAAYSGTVQVSDLQTMKHIFENKGAGVAAAVLLPKNHEGQHSVAIARRGVGLHVYSLPMGSLISEFSMPFSDVPSRLFSSQRLLAAAFSGRQLVIIYVNNNNGTWSEKARIQIGAHDSLILGEWSGYLLASRHNDFIFMSRIGADHWRSIQWKIWRSTPDGSLVESIAPVNGYMDDITLDRESRLYALGTDTSHNRILQLWRGGGADDVTVVLDARSFVEEAPILRARSIRGTHAVFTMANGFYGCPVPNCYPSQVINRSGAWSEIGSWKLGQVGPDEEVRDILIYRDMLITLVIQPPTTMRVKIFKLQMHCLTAGIQDEDSLCIIA